MKYNTPAYQAISSFYGDRKAKRSQQPLIKHIDEGLLILDKLGADNDIKDAFCIHPLIQNNEDEFTWKNFNISKKAIDYAFKYKYFANSYLCRPENDHIQSYTHLKKHFKGKKIPKPVALMLIADKVQNQSDFRKYHQNHKRAKQLDRYFINWCIFLILHTVFDAKEQLKIIQAGIEFKDEVR